MKTSIAISVLILAVTAGLGWKIERRLAAAQADEKLLTVEANRLGVSGGADPLDRSRKHLRIDRDAEAKQLAIEYHREAKVWESGPIIGVAEERYLEIHQRIEALDSSRLKAFVADVLNDSDVVPIMRAQRALKLLPILAKKDGQGALALFKEYYATIKISPGAGNIIPECLGAWAKNDPFAAVKWTEENAVEFPDAMKEAQDHIFRSAAEKDPALAFSLIEHLKLNSEKAYSAMLQIVIAAKTDEERNLTLSAFRQFQNTTEGNKELAQAAYQTFGYFAWKLNADGFTAATKWIDSAKLSPWELDRVCARLSLNYDGNEPGQWIEWMGERFPPGESDSHIMDLVRCWTNNDVEAAGKWLASAPDGPAKNAAIRSYGQEIFKHAPETAMQWIMTLPPGRDRDETLKTIYMNWSKDDPTGKEAFKMEHGIK